MYEDRAKTYLPVITGTLKRYYMESLTNSGRGNGVGWWKYPVVLSNLPCCLNYLLDSLLWCEGFCMILGAATVDVKLDIMCCGLTASL